MSPSDILLYSYISVFLGHHQRSSPPPAVNGNKYKDPQQTLCRERILGTLSLNWDVTINSFPLGIREHWKRGGRKDIRTRGHEGHQETKPFKSTWAKLVWTPRCRGSMHRACSSLHQVLCIYLMASSLAVVWYSWVCSWVSAPSLGLFSFCLLLLFNSVVIVFFFFF